MAVEPIVTEMQVPASGQGRSMGQQVPMRFRAVLFDWRLTLVHDPPLSWWVGRALASIGRPADEAEVASITERVSDAFDDPEHMERRLLHDTSAELHRASLMAVFDRAGIDGGLAEALYDLDFDPVAHPLYPDARDVLTSVRARGAKTALVSNIHFDLRPELAEQQILDLFDAVVLSFEHGIQKPDPRMFGLALETLGVRASETIMVGDSPPNDGAAAEEGITTLILPPLPKFGPRGLGSVLGLLDGVIVERTYPLD